MAKNPRNLRTHLEFIGLTARNTNYQKSGLFTHSLLTAGLGSWSPVYEQWKQVDRGKHGDVTSLRAYV
jgi:hypothetical protein